MPFRPIGPGIDDSDRDKVINENFVDFDNRLNPVTLKDKSGDRRVLIGKDSTDEYALKVSKSGFDAYDAANENLIFNSNQNTFKIVNTGTLTINNDGSTATVTTVAHGLSFVPIVNGYLNSATINIGSFSTTTGSIPLPTWVSININTTDDVVEFSKYVSLFADDTDIVATLFNSTGVATDITVTYYLLQETADV